MTKDEALRLALEALGSNRRTHHYCEDTWYSCPKHEDGCANDSEGDECNCGADKANAGIDQAITAIKAALEAKDEPVVWNEGVPAMFPKQKEGETFIVSYEPKLEAKDEPVGDNKVKQLVNQCTHRDIDGNWYVDGVQLVHATCDAIIKGTI